MTPPAVDMDAIRRLGRRPRRRWGCLLWLLTPLGVGLVAAAIALGYSRVEIGAARDACVGIPRGMPRLDAETRLITESDAHVMGWGGPSGEPPSSVEVGVRGDVVSWSCQITLDSDGNTIATQFHSWIAADPEGDWDEPFTAFLEDFLPG